MAGIIQMANQAAGKNNVSMTQSMRKEYGREAIEQQSDGKAAPVWEDWVRSKGYALNGQGLVVPAP